MLFLITLHTAKLADMAEVSHLLVESFFEGFAENPLFHGMMTKREFDRLTEHHGGDRHVQVLARDEGLAVGFVDLEYKGRAYVSDLAVLPSYRRQGVATELMGYCEARAREWGCHDVFLKVEPSNDAALAMYSKLGYSLSAMEKGKPLFRKLVKFDNL